MGIDYDGGMIVGEHVSKLDLSDIEDVWDWLEDNDLDDMSPYFDADIGQKVVGYRVSDTPMSDIDRWVGDIKAKAEKFEQLTGTPAKLIGTQNIW